MTHNNLILSLKTLSFINECFFSIFVEMEYTPMDTEYVELVRTVMKTDTVVGRRNAVRPTHGASRPAPGGVPPALLLPSFLHRPPPSSAAMFAHWTTLYVFAFQRAFKVPVLWAVFFKCFAAEEATRKRSERGTRFVYISGFDLHLRVTAIGCLVCGELRNLYRLMLNWKPWLRWTIAFSL